MRVYPCMILGLLLAMPHQPAGAWGFGGHKVIGGIADELLTPAAQQQVAALLEAEPAERRSLAAISTWADEIRWQRPETGPWHYVNINIHVAGYDAGRDCPDQACVVAQIELFQARLADPVLLPAVRLEALKFLVHLIGDEHQPLHSGDNADRGGNEVEVRFEGHRSNLHKLWDSEILNVTAFQHRNEADYAAELVQAITAEEQTSWGQGGPAEWANESQVVARDEIYQDLGEDLPEGGTTAPIVLPASYAQDHLPVVEQQLKRAGVRLAYVLEQALGQNDAPVTDTLLP